MCVKHVQKRTEIDKVLTDKVDQLVLLSVIP